MARKSGFGIFEAGTTTGYVAGWCPHCGRRRGNDGRCANCDPWFTSPLVQYGGPVVGAFTVFLIAGAFIIGARGSSSAGITPPGAPVGILGASPVAATSGFSLNALPQLPAVQSVTPAMPKPPDPASMTPSFTPHIYSPDERAYAEAENLRQTTAWTDWQVDNIRRQQEEQQRTENRGAGATMNRAVDSYQAMAQSAEVM